MLTKQMEAKRTRPQRAARVAPVGAFELAASRPRGESPGENPEPDYQE